MTRLLTALFLLCSSATTLAQVATPLPDLISFENNPQLFKFDTYTLRLPFIDFNGVPGQYQDATIEYSPLTKTWRLTGYREAVPASYITEVKPIVVGEVPVQVFLEVKGTLNNGCAQLGQVGMKRVSDVFTVYLFYTRTLAEFRDCVGTTDVRPFRKVIPLDLYGLPARTYTYSVNGKFDGSFTLAADNVLP